MSAWLSSSFKTNSGASGGVKTGGAAVLGGVTSSSCVKCNYPALLYRLYIEPRDDNFSGFTMCICVYTGSGVFRERFREAMCEAFSEGVMGWIKVWPLGNAITWN